MFENRNFTANTVQFDLTSNFLPPTHVQLRLQGWTVPIITEDNTFTITGILGVGCLFVDKYHYKCAKEAEEWS